MTCRGSRFADGAKRNPNGEVFMKNRETDEWLKQNQKATREFIRKWGHFVKHDQFLKPIIPSKYDVGFVVKNCNMNLLGSIEPWCSTIYIDNFSNLTNEYFQNEKRNTLYDLSERVAPYDSEKKNAILVEMDGTKLYETDFNHIQQLSEIIQNSGEIGTFELGQLTITINSLETYENNLIINKNRRKKDGKNR